MKMTLSTAVANLVQRADPEVEFRLEAQAEALRETQCVDRTVGQWIDAHDVDYLTSVLDLDDLNFAHRFPALAHMDHLTRQQMKNAIERHLRHCSHCYLKHGYELEIDAHILRACRENGAYLMQFLDEEEDLSEDDHLNINSPTKLPTDDTNCHSDPRPLINPVTDTI